MSKVWSFIKIVFGTAFLITVWFGHILFEEAERESLIELLTDPHLYMIIGGIILWSAIALFLNASIEELVDKWKSRKL